MSKIQTFSASKDVQGGRVQADGRDGNLQCRGSSFVREKVISFLYISHRQADLQTCGWLDVFLHRQTKHLSINKHTVFSLNGAYWALKTDKIFSSILIFLETVLRQMLGSLWNQSHGSSHTLLIGWTCSESGPLSRPVQRRLPSRLSTCIKSPNLPCLKSWAEIH